MSERRDGLAAPAAGALAGRRALVIGAETAAGGAIARAIGEAGADVALAVLRPDEGVLAARRLQRELRERGREAVTYAMDVTLGRNVQVTTRQAAKELGGLDLVASAPEEPFLAPLAETSDAQLARAMTLNGYAHAYAARAAFGEFRRGGRGLFLIVTRALGERPPAGAAAWAIACAAALGLLRALAREHPEGGLAAAALLRGAAVPAADGGGDGDPAAAIAAADASEGEALGRLACAVAAAPPDAVRGRAFSADGAPPARSGDGAP